MPFPKQDIKNPEDFAAMAKLVRPEDFTNRVLMTADLEAHTAHIQHYVDMGFDEIHLHNVGRNQAEFIEVFGREVLPKLRLTPRRRPRRREARADPALEPDARRAVAVEHVDRVDEADLLGLVGHHQRVRPGAAAEEADALEQVAGRSRRSRRRRGSRRTPGPRSVDAVLVAVAHPRAALALLVAAVAEAGLDLAAEAAQRGRRDDALRRAADAHHGVDAGARDGARDRRRQVAVADELDPRAGRADLGDQRVVARPLEDDDRDVADLPAERLGDPAEVLGRRSRMSTLPAATGPTHSFSM